MNLSNIFIKNDRRAFLKQSMVASMVLSTVGVSASCVKKGEKEEKETTVNEDLMREHGLLDRILLIYEENLKKEVNPKIVHGSAKLIQDFIENYHEKLEEEFLFPILEKISARAELVSTLKKQHEVGRKITAAILSYQDKTMLKQNISVFIPMYRAHAAREDTILFPAFKDAISANRYKELGEQFEERERKLFGEGGFETILAQVEVLEKEIGIFSLDMYTPKTL